MGSGLTEIEIFECLEVNFRDAADNCEKLATSPKRGQTYLKLREQLKFIESAARQAGYARGGDARWLQIGLMVAEAHKRAGDWLRGVKQPGGGYRPIPEGQKHPLFMRLAEILRDGQRKSERLRDQKTNRLGPILPRAQRLGSQRETTPVGWTRSSGGVFIPAA